MIRGLLAFALLLWVGGCASPPPPDEGEPPPLTAPAALCGDASLGPDSLCFPAERFESLRGSRLPKVLHVGVASGGTSRPRVLYLAVVDPRSANELVLRTKFAPAPPGGDGFNNSPRREVAAYEAQKLFLDPGDYVVPPAFNLCADFDWYRENIGRPSATFPGTACVFGTFSYWVENLTDRDARDFDRAEADPVYRRNLANLALFTHLISHRDSRDGNFLIAKDPDRPRVFSVDHDLAFAGFKNPGVYLFLFRDWSRLQVSALPAESVARMRAVTRADLDRLAVVEQYAIRDGQLVPSEPGPRMEPDRGVYYDDDVVQVGLARSEIDGIERRLKALLERVDAGEIETF